jgi:hypothetical protein
MIPRESISKSVKQMQHRGLNHRDREITSQSKPLRLFLQLIFANGLILLNDKEQMIS